MKKFILNSKFEDITKLFLNQLDHNKIFNEMGIDSILGYFHKDEIIEFKKKDLKKITNCQHIDRKNYAKVTNHLCRICVLIAIILQVG